MTKVGDLDYKINMGLSFIMTHMDNLDAKLMGLLCVFFIVVYIGGYFFIKLNGSIMCLLVMIIRVYQIIKGHMFLTIVSVRQWRVRINVETSLEPLMSNSKIVRHLTW